MKKWDKLLKYIDPGAKLKGMAMSQTSKILWTHRSSKAHIYYYSCMENEELLWTANVCIICLFSLQSLIKLNSIIITMKSVLWLFITLFFFFLSAKKKIANAV